MCWIGNVQSNYIFSLNYIRKQFDIMIIYIQTLLQQRPMIEHDYNNLLSYNYLSSKIT